MSKVTQNETILLVGHGSRGSNGNDEIEIFAKDWQASNPQWKIETCYIEFADVLLDAGLDHAARNSRRVIVIPLILNAAGHVKMEIPSHIEQARARYPATEFVYARHLGATDSILMILKRRLRQAMNTMDMPDPKSTGVIILGRGSSDRVANGELAKMSRWLFEETEHELVDMAFTGITHPRLELAVQRQVKLGMTQIAVLPYYLFTGTLIERIQRQILHLQQQYPQVRFAAGNYFGFEKEIYQLLTQRVQEAQGIDTINRMMECDGCRYRAEYHEHIEEPGHEHAIHEHTELAHTHSPMQCDGCHYRTLAEQDGLGHHHHGDEAHNHKHKHNDEHHHAHDTEQEVIA